jgi:hypothetical protein
MLRLTADVNGRKIGTIYVHNKEKELLEQSRYDAAIEFQGDMIIGIEDVRHRREQPFYVLVAKVIRRLPEML